MGSLPVCDRAERLGLAHSCQAQHVWHASPCSPRSPPILLPSTHTRSYFIYSCGTCTTYSNIRCFRDDLLKHPPDYFV